MALSPEASDATVSPSGVRIAKDFRNNLIIDRYDPVFADMRASKRKHLRSANSEDAVTWNVFRSLRQVEPTAWLPALFARAFPDSATPPCDRAVVKLWEPVRPPVGLLDSGDEGVSEIDIVIEAPEWVWFVEAKFRSDISTGTTTRPDRDQVLRNLDVGSYYAGVRAFYFSLLVVSEERSPDGAEKVRKYRDPQNVQAAIGLHRPDGAQNIKACSMLTWSDLHTVLGTAATQARREDERAFAERAAEWLQRNVLAARVPAPRTP